MKTLVCSVSPDGIARLDMARPQVFNAFDETMIAELDETIAGLAADGAVRVIVLGGQGKAFSAGADLQWMRRASQATLEWNLADAQAFAGMLYRLASCPKPTIARVHGLALGGGVGLVCACDIAVASDAAAFATSEARLGIIPAVIGPYLVNAVGKRQAMHLGLTAGRIDAATALEIGLVQRVVAPDALDAAIDTLLADMLQNGPGALAAIKALFGELHVGPVTPDVRAQTAQAIATARTSGEAREGFAAFFEKRPASWVVRR